jgi:hypothetical protein
MFLNVLIGLKLAEIEEAFISLGNLFRDESKKCELWLFFNAHMYFNNLTQ